MEFYLTVVSLEDFVFQKHFNYFMWENEIIIVNPRCFLYVLDLVKNVKLFNKMVVFQLILVLISCPQQL